MAHRLWQCTHPALVAARRRHVPPWVLERALVGVESGHTAGWERALFPVPALASARRGPFNTFEWDKQPEFGVVDATFYPDGSRCGGSDPLVASYGWALEARNGDGSTVAVAHGVPPWWVRSVAAAETWALSMAGISSAAPSRFRTDCLGVSQLYARGRLYATAGRQVCASAWKRFFGAVGSEDADVGWIPAHTSEADIGVTISADDRGGNAAADVRAKSAAETGMRPTWTSRRSQPWTASLQSLRLGLGTPGS